MAEQSSSLNGKKIFIVWLPLAAMWLIMGIEQPLIAAFIARMEDAKINLAAFGVTFSLALIIESPIIQMLAASTALSGRAANYRKLLSFMHILALLLTAVHLIVSIPSVYGFVIEKIIGAPPELTEESRKAFFWMFPWTAAVGYRRLWQGVLIRYKHTKVIPITMVLRICASFIVLVAGLSTGFAEGAVCGALALTAGVCVGALSAFLYARPVIKHRIYGLGKNNDGEDEEEISYHSLIRFYLPLVATSAIMLALRPIQTLGIARAPEALDSLAVWPVILGFLFIFNSVALSLQEVIIALCKNDEDARITKQFVIRVAGSMLLIYLAIALSPLRSVWFRTVAGLSEDLMPYVTAPVLIIALSPALVSILSYYRGIRVWKKQTIRITYGVIINFFCLVIILFAGAALFPVPGVVTAAISVVAAFAAETWYQWRTSLL
jgi:hypothetical protein